MHFQRLHWLYYVYTYHGVLFWGNPKSYDSGKNHPQDPWDFGIFRYIYLQFTFNNTLKM